MSYRIMVADHFVRGVVAATIAEARERARAEAARLRAVVSVVRVVDGAHQVVDAYQPTGEHVGGSYTIRVGGHMLAGVYGDDDMGRIARELARPGLDVVICDAWGEPMTRAS